jgi:hypothetical protein
MISISVWDAVVPNTALPARTGVCSMRSITSRSSGSHGHILRHMKSQNSLSRLTTVAGLARDFGGFRPATHASKPR